MATTPVGVAHAHTVDPRDQATEPDRLMREDGSPVCWGDTATGWARPHAEVDVWNLPAGRCTCRCHDEQPALTTARSTP